MDLTTVLIILGVIILALVGHGIWANRREKSTFFKNTNTFVDDARVEHDKNNTKDSQNIEQTVATSVNHSQDQQIKTTLSDTQDDIVVNVAENVVMPIQQDIRQTTSMSDKNLDLSNPVHNNLSPSISHDKAELVEEHNIVINKNKEVEEKQSTEESKSIINEIENVVDNLSVEEAVGKIKIHVPTAKVHKEKNLSELSIAELEASIEDENEGFNTNAPQIREQLANMASHKVDLNTVKSSDSVADESQQINNLKTPIKNDVVKQDPTNLSKDELVQENTIEKNITQEPSHHTETESVEKVEERTQPEPAKEETKPSIIMLYIVAPEGRDFNGEDLANTFEKEGFLFGDKQIYHRHADLSSESPVLFSAANVQNPGVFDPKNMEDFTTFGIVLFMQLPSAYGHDLTNLRLMITTAKAMADELNGSLLTDQREPFDSDAEDFYLSKVI